MNIENKLPFANIIQINPIIVDSFLEEIEEIEQKEEVHERCIPKSCFTITITGMICVIFLGGLIYVLTRKN